MPSPGEYAQRRELQLVIQLPRKITKPPAGRKCAFASTAKKMPNLLFVLVCDSLCLLLLLLLFVLVLVLLVVVLDSPDWFEDVD